MIIIIVVTIIIIIIIIIILYHTIYTIYNHIYICIHRFMSYNLLSVDNMIPIAVLSELTAITGIFCQVKQSGTSETVRSNPSKKSLCGGSTGPGLGITSP
jgi:hypothetical protein